MSQFEGKDITSTAVTVPTAVADLSTERMELGGLNVNSERLAAREGLGGSPGFDVVPFSSPIMERITPDTLLTPQERKDIQDLQNYEESAPNIRMTPNLSPGQETPAPDSPKPTPDVSPALPNHKD